MKTSIAIYPGSFDPVTNGHLDLIERGEKMFDLLIVAVLRNTEKQPLFSVPERVEMLREVTRKWSDVEVDVFDGLLVDYARKRGAGDSFNQHAELSGEHAQRPAGQGHLRVHPHVQEQRAAPERHYNLERDC